jgi:predicted GNAT family acetyltransferase
MAVVRDGGIVRLAAIMTPPHALVVSAGDPEAIPHLVEALRRAGIQPPGVSGLEPMAERFAASWQGGKDAGAEPALRMILYRSDRIAAPRDVRGTLRPAAADDLDLLAAWQHRFAKQANLSAAEQTADMRAVMAARVARDEMFLWAVEGRPVASAGFVPTTPADDAGRINAVFTLEQERGKGYASACVGALSQRLLDRGWRYCLIFADRGNASTNRIYARLGYREIAAFATIGLAAGDD